MIYGSSVNGPVCHKCPPVIGKFMYVSNVDIISSLNNTTNISGFLTEVLAWKDPQVLVPTLQIVAAITIKAIGHQWYSYEMQACEPPTTRPAKGRLMRICIGFKHMNCSFLVDY